jgi:hypothetical protein
VLGDTTVWLRTAGRVKVRRQVAERILEICDFRCGVSWELNTGGLMGLRHPCSRVQGMLCDDASQSGGLPAKGL